MEGENSEDPVKNVKKETSFCVSEETLDEHFNTHKESVWEEDIDISYDDMCISREESNSKELQIQERYDEVSIINKEHETQLSKEESSENRKPLSNVTNNLNGTAGTEAEADKEKKEYTSVNTNLKEDDLLKGTDEYDENILKGEMLGSDIFDSDIFGSDAVAADNSFNENNIYELDIKEDEQNKTEKPSKSFTNGEIEEAKKIHSIGQHYDVGILEGEEEKVEEVEEVEEVEKGKEIEEVEKVEKGKKIEEVEEVEKGKKIEEVEEVEKGKKIEEVEEVEKGKEEEIFGEQRREQELLISQANCEIEDKDEEKEKKETTQFDGFLFWGREQLKKHFNFGDSFGKEEEEEEEESKCDRMSRESKITYTREKEEKGERRKEEEKGIQSNEELSSNINDYVQKRNQFFMDKIYEKETLIDMLKQDLNVVLQSGTKDLVSQYEEKIKFVEREKDILQKEHAQSLHHLPSYEKEKLENENVLLSGPVDSSNQQIVEQAEKIKKEKETLQKEEIENEEVENKKVEKNEAVEEIEVENKEVENKEVENKEGVEEIEVENKEVENKEVEKTEVEKKEVEKKEVENKEVEKKKENVIIGARAETKENCSHTNERLGEMETNEKRQNVEGEANGQVSTFFENANECRLLLNIDGNKEDLLVMKDKREEKDIKWEPNSEGLIAEKRKQSIALKNKKKTIHTSSDELVNEEDTLFLVEVESKKCVEKMGTPLNNSYENRGIKEGYSEEKYNKGYKQKDNEEYGEEYNKSVNSLDHERNNMRVRPVALEEMSEQTYRANISEPGDKQEAFINHLMWKNIGDENEKAKENMHYKNELLKKEDTQLENNVDELKNEKEKLLKQREFLGNEGHIQLGKMKKKNDEVRDDEIKNDEIKNDEIKNDEIKNVEIKNDEIRIDEIKNVEIKNDEIRNDEIKNVEISNDEIKNDEIKNDEIKNVEIRNDEIKNDEISNDEIERMNVLVTENTVINQPYIEYEKMQNEANEKIITLQKLLNEKKSQVFDMENEIFEKDATIEALKVKIQKQQIKMSETQKNVNELNGNIISLSRKLHLCEKQLSESQLNFSVMEEKLQCSEEEKKEIENAHRNAIQEVNVRLCNLEKELEDTKKENIHLREINQHLKNSVEKSEYNISHLKFQLENFEKIKLENDQVFQEQHNQKIEQLMIENKKNCNMIDILKQEKMKILEENNLLKKDLYNFEEEFKKIEKYSFDIYEIKTQLQEYMEKNRNLIEQLEREKNQKEYLKNEIRCFLSKMEKYNIALKIYKMKCTFFVNIIKNCEDTIGILKNKLETYEYLKERKNRSEKEVQVARNIEESIDEFMEHSMLNNKSEDIIKHTIFLKDQLNEELSKKKRVVEKMNKLMSIIKKKNLQLNEKNYKIAKYKMLIDSLQNSVEGQQANIKTLNENINNLEKQIQLKQGQKLIIPPKVNIHLTKTSTLENNIKSELKELIGNSSNFLENTFKYINPNAIKKNLPTKTFFSTPGLAEDSLLSAEQTRPQKPELGLARNIKEQPEETLLQRPIQEPTQHPTQDKLHGLFDMKKRGTNERTEQGIVQGIEKTYLTPEKMEIVNTEKKEKINKHCEVSSFLINENVVNETDNKKGVKVVNNEYIDSDSFDMNLCTSDGQKKLPMKKSAFSTFGSCECTAETKKSGTSNSSIFFLDDAPSNETDLRQARNAEKHAGEKCIATLFNFDKKEVTSSVGESNTSLPYGSNSIRLTDLFKFNKNAQIINSTDTKSEGKRNKEHTNIEKSTSWIKSFVQRDNSELPTNRKELNIVTNNDKSKFGKENYKTDEQTLLNASLNNIENFNKFKNNIDVQLKIKNSLGASDEEFFIENEFNRGDGVLEEYVDDEDIEMKSPSFTRIHSRANRAVEQKKNDMHMDGACHIAEKNEKHILIQHGKDKMKESVKHKKEKEKVEVTSNLEAVFNEGIEDDEILCNEVWDESIDIDAF